MHKRVRSEGLVDAARASFSASAAVCEPSQRDALERLTYA